MFPLLFKAPGICRTIAATLVIAANVVDAVGQATDVSSGLHGAALVAAVVGLVRAGLRAAVR